MNQAGCPGKGRIGVRLSVAIGLLFAALFGVFGCGTRSPRAAVSAGRKPLARHLAGPAPRRKPSAPLPVNPRLASWKPTSTQFEQAPAKTRLVALTFDAGSTADAVPRILKCLAAHHAHATFFLTGKFCKKYPKACRAIAAAGMELGNHSYSHPRFTPLSASQIRSQLRRAETEIVKVCGRSAKPLFRFPYGDYDRRVGAVVAKMGYQPIYWTLDSLDAFGKPKSADFVAARIDRKIKSGYITLMHVSSVGSADALPRIFAQLDRRGIRVVPVSALLLHSPQARHVLVHTASR